MDPTDESILNLLQQNGRRSNRVIARELGLPARQVGSRIQRMLAHQEMRILAVADMASAGFDFMLFIGIEVAGLPADEVADELAQIPEILSVMLTMGSCDIEVVAVADNHASLVRLVTQDLARVRGIRSLQLSLGLQTLKYATVMGPLIDRPQIPMRFPENGRVDNMDKAIIERLWIDARSTNQTIADELGVSESAVRVRINAMHDRNLIRITAMRNMRVEHGEMFASIGVEVAGRSVDDVARDLAALSNVGFVATVLGRYHILVMGLLGSAHELSELLMRQIERMPGVSKVHTSQVLNFVKYDYYWTTVIEEANA
ncbi:MAG: Lrp/AsnC family transcriptional regulator [Gammaproteobacteria bacterium]|jgi:Lrp/AsnC family transcriptional regulator for asnA, asnC and gidA|nr:Lrp/AsnC family transcriptional regulator [Gammaproteobacteria bacterium]MBP6053155.1 Lrp/AsnC family transcriptional regulator [Pseudomonadales bacterium]MBK6584542.1 Lrp/AsnC family transcriptional regulator [Gammaproteobacteria bacterium]MBK7169198.1 Lrp/AsnC family transcriptional regulator [Gammaproteobacteria bacterium]MBK7519954.1 Lrp/AsnC family transcriptional regulator [Gammaproteobacteria bacterium]